MGKVCNVLHCFSEPKAEQASTAEAKLTVRACVDPGGPILLDGRSQPRAAEAFRALAQKLHHLRRSGPLRSVLVTSVVPREGKTVISVNLAAVLARTGARVLLVEGDMRSPGVGAALGVCCTEGLANCLEQKATADAVIRTVAPFGFAYLAAGHCTGNAAELLHRDTVRELFERIPAAFDWIVVDTPPLSLFADANCLAEYCDRVLLVVRAGVSQREAVQEALKSFDAARVAGVVLNAYDGPRQPSYYSRYYGSTDSRRE